MYGKSEKDWVRLDIHDGAVTLLGLRDVLKTMRWADLESFAETIEGYRRQTRSKSTRPFTTELLDNWVCNTEPEDEI